ncbi:SRPBCC family protein [Parasphingopyxis lamellibrachiae]|uniref:Uncharacterized protein YndB with AHSA1/START domain n=1 Tax=Parasphingopyxis lamellibrachiae TaxID=680125 RepID=A0A3D9FFR7_9SPHN|nr:SRPBCC domain-containing protein [Parasphingopyxis lamellibrachiae]RED16468.1 uncharacterized protein YndB with AHSA1/START domain [Parasphingopyxis lamellibrachiae]
MTVRVSVILAAYVVAAPSPAEVTLSDTGFTATNSAAVSARPADVWAALINPVLYWNPNHSWFGDASGFSLDPVAGGCFCESNGDGGSAEHMRVVMVQPNRTLRLSGALGPLQGEGLAGVLTWQLDEIEGGTRVTQTYSVGGHMQFDREELAPVVDGVVREQLERLTALFPSD